MRSIHLPYEIILYIISFLKPINIFKKYNYYLSYKNDRIINLFNSNNKFFLIKSNWMFIEKISNYQDDYIIYAKQSHKNLSNIYKKYDHYMIELNNYYNKEFILYCNNLIEKVSDFAYKNSESIFGRKIESDIIKLNHIENISFFRNLFFFRYRKCENNMLIKYVNGGNIDLEKDLYKNIPVIFTFNINIIFVENKFIINNYVRDIEFIKMNDVTPNINININNCKNSFKELLKLSHLLSMKISNK